MLQINVKLDFYAFQFYGSIESLFERLTAKNFGLSDWELKQLFHYI